MDAGTPGTLHIPPVLAFGKMPVKIQGKKLFVLLIVLLENLAITELRKKQKSKYKIKGTFFSS